MGNPFAITRVCIVDSNNSDYADLKPITDEFSVCILADGRSGLRAARRQLVDIWMINVQLTDMTGFKLLEIIRSVAVPKPIITLGDEYRSEDERMSLLHGASYYACKPLDAVWLINQFLPNLSSIETD